VLKRADSSSETIRRARLEPSVEGDAPRAATVGARKKGVCVGQRCPATVGMQREVERMPQNKIRRRSKGINVRGRCFSRKYQNEEKPLPA